MTKVKAYIHGIYPRSSDLIQVSRDLLRKRSQEADYVLQYKKDCESFLKLQVSVKLDYIEDGKLAWHDIFRPIVEATDGMEIGALTRWFDNNCFFRQPILTGTLKLDENKLDKFFIKIAPNQKWKVTLPSPFTFAKLALNNTDLSFEDVLNGVTKIMCKVTAYLESRGVTFVQFNEPYLPYNGAKDADLRLFKKSLEQLVKVKGKLTIAYHFYFGDAAPVIASLPKKGFIDIVGVDFYKTALSSLPKDFPFALAAGIIDGRNSLLEDKATLKQFINEAAKTINSDIIYITNSSDLDLLPETIARQKIELLTKVRDSF